jgi:heme/copper-type cytochrome/quinol oxidase subunit 2
MIVSRFPNILRIGSMIAAAISFMPVVAKAELVLADCPALLHTHPTPFASVDDIKKQVVCADWMGRLDALRYQLVPLLALQRDIFDLAIAFALLRSNRPTDALTITVTGQQFAWGFDYSADSNRSEACIIENELVLPQGKPVMISVTSEDIIHEWTVPSLGLKVDGVPGRLNQVAVDTSLLAEHQGGSTAISGSRFTEMAFTLRIVDQDTYRNWERRMLQDKGCASTVFAQ